MMSIIFLGPYSTVCKGLGDTFNLSDDCAVRSSTIPVLVQMQACWHSCSKDTYHRLYGEDAEFSMSGRVCFLMSCCWYRHYWLRIVVFSATVTFNCSRWPRIARCQVRVFWLFDNRWCTAPLFIWRGWVHSGNRLLRPAIRSCLQVAARDLCRYPLQSNGSVIPIATSLTASTVHCVLIGKAQEPNVPLPISTFFSTFFAYCERSMS